MIIWSKSIALIAQYLLTYSFCQYYCYKISSGSPEPAVKDAPAPPLQPLYTIEQIELVRRLKNSGMTKEQLIMAYDSFDRLEQDLGHVYTVPVTFAQQMPQLAMQPLMAQMMGQNTMGAQALAAFTAAQETLAQQLQVCWVKMLKGRKLYHHVSYLLHLHSKSNN